MELKLGGLLTDSGAPRATPAPLIKSEAGTDPHNKVRMFKGLDDNPDVGWFLHTDYKL